MDLSLFFISWAASVSLVVIITGYINTKLLATSTTTVHRIVSWVVALAVAFFGGWKDLGMFAELNTLWTAIYGIGLGLVSNGIFTIEAVQAFLLLIGARKK